MGAHGFGTPPLPLTDMEKATFDTIKQVTRSPRPQDLSLSRMLLDGKQVAVVGQNVYSSETAEYVGWQPLAMLLDDDTVGRLRSISGETPEPHTADGLEGAS